MFNVNIGDLKKKVLATADKVAGTHPMEVKVRDATNDDPWGPHGAVCVNPCHIVSRYPFGSLTPARALAYSSGRGNGYIAPPSTMFSQSIEVVSNTLFVSKGMPLSGTAAPPGDKHGTLNLLLLEFSPYHLG